MTKKKRANACRDHLYGGSEGGLPPPTTRGGRLSPEIGALGATARKSVLLAPSLKEFRAVGRWGGRDEVRDGVGTLRT